MDVEEPAAAAMLIHTITLQSPYSYNHQKRQDRKHKNLFEI